MAEMIMDGVQMNAVVSVPATINMDGVTVNVVTRLAGANQYKRTPRVELLEALAGSTGVPLNPVQYDIGPVVNEDPPSAKATIDLIALEASGKRRATPVVYRRRNPNELFQSLELDNFKPTDANPIGSLSQLVDALNRIYGLTLAVKDFKAVEISQGSNTVVTTSPTSWYFEPNISISLGRLDANERSTEIVGLAWSEVDRTQLRIASADFTPQAANLATLTGSTLANDVQTTVVITALNAILGTTHGLTTAFYTAGGRGLRGLPIQQLALPAVSNPLVDNSGFYNRALIIDLDLATGFNFRYLILHYNV